MIWVTVELTVREFATVEDVCELLDFVEKCDKEYDVVTDIPRWGFARENNMLVFEEEVPMHIASSIREWCNTRDWVEYDEY